ncbi:MAG: hypothetical protein ACLT98_03395 [Eggerthellaceae bacterium]
MPLYQGERRVNTDSPSARDFTRDKPPDAGHAFLSASGGAPLDRWSGAQNPLGGTSHGYFEERAFSSFLTLGGVAALGGAAALAGCAPQASNSANADARRDRQRGFRDADRRPDEECDIAIVGAGGAGMWAAVEAMRAGRASSSSRGGNVGVANGSLAGGPFMVGSAAAGSRRRVHGGETFNRV